MDKYLQSKKKELIKKLQEYKKPIAVIGVTAFNRIGPSFFLPNYQIICYKDSSDIDWMVKKGFKILSIQKDFPTEDLKKTNTLEILKHKQVQDYLKNLGEAKVLIYRTSEEIDKITNKLGLSIIANSEPIRQAYEDKKKFREIGKEAGLELIPGETLRLKILNIKKWQQLMKKYGRRLVFQLTEFDKGGGKGTFFINNKEDFRLFWKAVKSESEKLNWVNIAKFIKGPSPSITGCVTKHGILCGLVQTQILDIPEVKTTDRSGVFCGHDWSFCHYPENIQSQAEKICARLGEYMIKHNYKGIYGIDLVIDEETSKVYPVECNARYTGAFPVYSMMQESNGEIPLDVFQLLEFLNIDYQIDVKKINQSLRTAKKGAHLVLANLNSNNWSKIEGGFPAGVYQYNNGEVKFLRGGFSYSDIEEENEFVYTDGCPRPGSYLKPNMRLGKLIFKRQIIGKDRQLLPETKLIVKKVYRKLKIKKIIKEKPQWDHQRKKWIF